MIGNPSKSTRERVLHTLLSRHRCTINELAEIVGINPISVRHHVTRLQAQGLVQSEEERHGVGRPHQIYSLTEAGLERFPSRYLRLTIRLLKQLKETVPESMVKQLFAQIAQDMASDYSAEVSGLTMEERLDFVQEVLTEEGFTVEWEQKGDNYFIHGISCPYYHVGQDHPEICSVDQTLISTVLSVPTEKIQCVLDGDTRCTYVIQDPILLEKE